MPWLQVAAVLAFPVSVLVRIIVLPLAAFGSMVIASRVFRARGRMLVVADAVGWHLGAAVLALVLFPMMFAERPGFGASWLMVPASLAYLVALPFAIFFSPGRSRHLTRLFAATFVACGMILLLGRMLLDL